MGKPYPTREFFLASHTAAERDTKVLLQGNRQALRLTALGNTGTVP